MYKKQYVGEKQRSPIFNDYLSIQYNPEDLFTITDFIGKGAYGTVHKAIHNQTQMTVAIKIISIGSTAQTISLQNETSLMKLCNESENILKYYGSYFSKKNQEIWIILEYCEGGSAVDLMYAMNQSFTEEQIASIIEMILNGLVSLHEKKLIHRDVKGANILINSEGDAKLGDFGVGVQLNENENMRHSLRGSPHWMSPQVASYLDYDYKTDIWSLGITCIELKEGEPPLSNLKAANVIKTIASEPFKVLPNDNHYTQEFNDFVQSCLIVDPAKRPSAQDLLSHPFITRYSQGKKCIANLVMCHFDDLEKYRQEQVSIIQRECMNEEEEIEENEDEYNGNRILDKDNKDDDNNNNNEIIRENILKKLESLEKELCSNNNNNNNNNTRYENINDDCNENDLEGSVIIHTPRSEDNNNSPEFKKYINNGKIIIDDYDYIKNVIQHVSKIPQEVTTPPPQYIPTNNLNKNNYYNNNDDTLTENDLHIKQESNISDKTNRYSYCNSLINSNTKYTFLQKYRNNNLSTLDLNPNNSNYNTNYHSPSPRFQTKTENEISSFTINELLKDKEMRDLNDSKLKQKIQQMTTEKNNKLKNINNQYNTQIKKCEYALKILSQFPNVKSLSEYEKKYLMNDETIKDSNVYDEEEDLKDEDEDEIKKHTIQKSTTETPSTKADQHTQEMIGRILQSQKFQVNQVSNEFGDGMIDEENIVYNTFNIVHTGTFKKHSVYFGYKP